VAIKRHSIGLQVPPDLWAKVKAAADARYQSATAWVVDAIITKLRAQ
jgi:uncharacterized protein (DUF1778 family)